MMMVVMWGRKKTFAKICKFLWWMSEVFHSVFILLSIIITSSFPLIDGYFKVSISFGVGGGGGGCVTTSSSRSSDFNCC